MHILLIFPQQTGHFIYYLKSEENVFQNMFFYINYVFAVTMCQSAESCGVWGVLQRVQQKCESNKNESVLQTTYNSGILAWLALAFVYWFSQLKNTVIFTKNSNIMYNVTNCLVKLNVSQRFFVWKLSLVNTVSGEAVMFYPIWLHLEEACHKWGELPHLPACSPPNPRTPVRGEWKGLHSGWPVLHLKVDFRGDCEGTGKADRAGHYFLCYICIPWRKMTRLSRQQKCFNCWFCITIIVTVDSLCCCQTQDTQRLVFCQLCTRIN